MIAARVHEWGAEPVVEEVPDPVPGAGETLVAIGAAAVAHIDLTVAGGRFAFKPELPHVPGCDGAGRVVSSSSFPAGASVRIRGARVGLTRDGTWAELAAVPDAALDWIPDDLEPAVGACFFVPCATAWEAVCEVGRLERGERVAVVGAGGAVGALAVQLALRGGAAEVIGVETAARVTAVPAGARITARLEPGDAVDLLIDTVGGLELQERLAAVRPGGRCALVGYAAGTDASFDLPGFLAADVRLLPVNLIRAEPRLRARASELLALLRGGGVALDVTCFPLAAAAEAVDALRTGGGRIAVIPKAGGARCQT